MIKKTGNPHPSKGLLSPYSPTFSLPIPSCTQPRHLFDTWIILTKPLLVFSAPLSLTLQIPCFFSSILSVRIICWPSTVMVMTENVVKIDARVVDAEIMKTIIICSRAACWTEEPPRIAPVIMPGIAMIPRTLIYQRRLVFVFIERLYNSVKAVPHVINGGRQCQS